MAHHREVVRDEQVGQPVTLLDVLHQVQHLRLHRHVERRGRLVADQELRIRSPARARSRCAGAARRRTGAAAWRHRRPTGRPRPAARPRARATPARPDIKPCSTSGSATMSATLQRGFRLAYGSWKIICRRRRSAPACPEAKACVMSMPSKRTCPAVGVCRPTSRRATVLLPQPDSPTSPSVCPRWNREADAVDRVHELRRAALDHARRATAPTRRRSC